MMLMWRSTYAIHVSARLCRGALIVESWATKRRGRRNVDGNVERMFYLKLDQPVFGVRDANLDFIADDNGFADRSCQCQHG